MPRDLLNSAVVRLACLAASAAMLWYGTGLHPVWWLTWIAPLPVLYAAARANQAAAFFMAFGAWAIGDLNMWQYLYGLLGVPLRIAVLADLTPALTFAVAVMAWRAFARRGALIRAALCFAVIWVCYEFALRNLSVHSTFGNLAYTQMDCLPVIQIAALAGVAGISFLLFFIPGAVAAIFCASSTKRHRMTLAGITIAVAVLVLGWGGLRLIGKPSGPTVTVGLIASDLQPNLRPRDPEKIRTTFEDYAVQAQNLIRQGARLIIIPEKSAVISGASVDIVDQILSTSAANGATIAAGLERWTDGAKLNEIRLYGPDGKLQATYEKHHMLPPFESYLLPGKTLTTVSEPSGKWGLEICKDMDFPALSREYGNSGVGLLIVPAWDFDADGWLHGRMAILRGVESGFSIARAPKEGVLTVSDDRGRVLAQRESNSAPFATLIATVPVVHDETLYDRWGDWFARLNVAALAGLILSLAIIRV
jgi:apolipoprotein N-acyltransferase